MCLDRRDFIRWSAGAAGIALLGSETSRALTQGELPEAIRRLKPMTDGITPISKVERKGRLEKAQKLMVHNGLDALYIEPGPSLFYYTGIRWRPRERMFAIILPARGKPAYVCPAFEEGRARQMIQFGDDIRTWHEHVSPYKRVAQIFKDRGITAGKVGIEEMTRYFLVDGIRKESPGIEFVIADPVTKGCRMTKSPAEIALMRKANDVTTAAYKAVIASLWEGMTESDLRRIAAAAHQQLGVPGGLVGHFGESSAYAHGSTEPPTLEEGHTILMDGNCEVEGYWSDISRTIVFGKPTARQREVWNVTKEAQSAALAAAKPGVPCEEVNAAARQVVTEGGFGPDYEYFEHRVGHGIGVDVHEWTYLVRDNKTPLRTGMCFSNEPAIYIEGEFGVRIEDCMYITEDGVDLFSPQSPSIEQPFV